MTETKAGPVQQIWRYPVKSMAGEQRPEALVTEYGLLGDRGWAVRDERRGGIRGAKKIRNLMQCGAAYADEPSLQQRVPPVQITLPDGSRVRSDASDVSERLSDALQHPVTLWPLQPASDRDHYRRGAADHDDVVEELRDIFGRREDEPLPDLSVFPPEIIEFESPPGTYFDAYPVHLITTTSLRTIARLGGREHVDVRRFRPNIVVDTPDADGFPENDWVGRSLRLGDTVLDVVTACPRCVMVTLPQQELPVDRQLLRTVVRDAGQNVGVYARVRAAGTLHVGDEVRVGAVPAAAAQT